MQRLCLTLRVVAFAVANVVDAIFVVDVSTLISTIVVVAFVVRYAVVTVDASCNVVAGNVVAVDICAYVAIMRSFAVGYSIVAVAVIIAVVVAYVISYVVAVAGVDTAALLVHSTY